MTVEIRMATASDAVDACHLLRRAILECCMEDHRNDGTILGTWLGNKNPENVAAWFSSAANFSLVALVDEKVAGVAVMTRTGKIVLFYLCPAQRSTGVGKALLHAMETQAVQSGLRSVQVASTQTAKPFLLRNGYVVVGSATSAFGTEAVSMSKKLCPGAYPKKKFCRCTAT